MAGRRLVVLGVFAFVAGCRSTETSPPERRPDAVASARHTVIDVCKEDTECLKVGGFERCVPLVDPEHLEGASRLSGCVVGIRGGALAVARSCEKATLPAASVRRRESRCRSCEAGTVALSSATGSIRPYKDGKPWACAASTSCDTVKCDFPPGRYDVIGRLGVLVSGDYRLDVLAIEPTRKIPPPPL